MTPIDNGHEQSPLSKVVRHTLSEEQTLLKNEDMILLKSGKKAEQRKNSGKKPKKRNFSAKSGRGGNPVHDQQVANMVPV
jgi:hypothetical protein